MPLERGAADPPSLRHVGSLGVPKIYPGRDSIENHRGNRPGWRWWFCKPCILTRWNFPEGDYGLCGTAWERERYNTEVRHRRRWDGTGLEAGERHFTTTGGRRAEWLSTSHPFLPSSLSVFVSWTAQDNAITGLGKNRSPPVNTTLDLEDGPEAEGSPAWGRLL